MNSTATRTKKVLVVEDDRELVDLLALHLDAEGYQVTAAVDGEAGLRAFQGGRYDLVILDWMLPSLTGIELLQELRRGDPRTPVLMLTARGEEADKVLGLELGCDDYLVKPFGMRELTARIKVLLRRITRAEELAQRRTGDTILELGNVVIDPSKRRVTVRGKEITLTVKEYDLLHNLASHPGRTFSRRQLLDRVWKEGADVFEHTVNSHVNRLRNKIEENPNQPRLILTVWGVGYRYNDDFLEDMP
ncbi:DNA-binding response regulator [bacterium]|nr:MAG: DNA-binding response regulator [bacterium]